MLEVQRSWDQLLVDPQKPRKACTRAVRIGPWLLRFLSHVTSQRAILARFEDNDYETGFAFSKTFIERFRRQVLKVQPHTECMFSYDSWTFDALVNSARFYDRFTTGWRLGKQNGTFTWTNSKVPDDIYGSFHWLKDEEVWPFIVVFS